MRNKSATPFRKRHLPSVFQSESVSDVGDARSTAEQLVPTAGESRKTDIITRNGVISITNDVYSMIADNTAVTATRPRGRRGHGPKPNQMMATKEMGVVTAKISGQWAMNR